MCSPVVHTPLWLERPEWRGDSGRWPGRKKVEAGLWRVSKTLLGNWDNFVESEGASNGPEQGNELLRCTLSIATKWVTLKSTSPALTSLSKFRYVFRIPAGNLYMAHLLPLPTGPLRSFRSLIDLTVCDSSKNCRAEKLTFPLGRMKIKKRTEKPYSRGKAKKSNVFKLKKIS